MSKSNFAAAKSVPAPAVDASTLPAPVVVVAHKAITQEEATTAHLMGLQDGARTLELSDVRKKAAKAAQSAIIATARHQAIVAAFDGEPLPVEYKGLSVTKLIDSRIALKLAGKFAPQA